MRARAFLRACEIRCFIVEREKRPRFPTNPSPARSPGAREKKMMIPFFLGIFFSRIHKVNWTALYILNMRSEEERVRRDKITLLDRT